MTHNPDAAVRPESSPPASVQQGMIPEAHGGTPSAQLRVLLLSQIGTAINPYLGLLADALSTAGAVVERSGRPDTAVATPNRPDVIHIHWLEHLEVPRPYQLAAWAGATDPLRRVLRHLLLTIGNANAVGQVRRWLRLRALLSRLERFQAAGGCVAYTVHNLSSHEGGSPVERWGTHRLLRLADVIHVHDQSTVGELGLHPADLQRIAVVPHGHYIGSYPNTVSRAEARARLGIPDGAFVFLMLGLLRPYKGLEELLPAFRSITDPDALLLVAGKAGDADYMSRLSGLAAGDPRIWLRPGFVATEDVQVHMNAADVCVLPYRQITTSGAAVLAFSFGRPVVAPRLGAFSSLVDQSRGVLYDPAGQAALAAALEQARQTDWMGSAPEIRAWVAQCDWTAIGEQLLAAYRTALGRSERRAASGDS